MLGMRGIPQSRLSPDAPRSAGVPAAAAGRDGNAAPGRRGPGGHSAPRVAGPDAPGHHVRPGDSIQQALEKLRVIPSTRRCSSMPGPTGPRRRVRPSSGSTAARRHHAAGRRRCGADGGKSADCRQRRPQPSGRRQPRGLFRRRHLAEDGLARLQITGANNFTTGSGERSPIESDDVRKTLFFYSDGGGIKIYARSYPTIEQVEVYGNYTSPCGGGVSVEHLDQVQEAATFRNCVFRNNRTQTTGSAVDLLHGSRAVLRTACSSATSPIWASTTSACSRVANTIRRTGQERSPSSNVACDGQPVHVHRQLERRRRRRQRQHLRQLHFLEEQPARRDLAGQTLRDRHRRRRRREGVLHQR